MQSTLHVRGPGEEVGCVCYLSLNSRVFIYALFNMKHHNLQQSMFIFSFEKIQQSYKNSESGTSGESHHLEWRSGQQGPKAPGEAGTAHCQDIENH